MSSPCVRVTDRIWGSAPEVLQKTSTLVRLARSYEIIDPSDYEQLTALWLKAADGCFDSSEVILKHLGKRLSPIYEPELSKAKSIEDIKLLARKFLKDKDSLSTKPIVTSHRGVSGFTLLGRYSRFSERAGKVLSKALVIKLTDGVEVPSNHLFEQFSKGFRIGDQRFGFLTAKTAGIDFTRSTHRTHTGQTVPIDVTTAKELRKNIQELAKLFKRTDPIEHLMIAKRVNGENMFDFVRKRWEGLTESQQVTILKQMGKIAPLDVVLGYNDRFFKAFFDQPRDSDKLACILDDEFFSANLGNLLIDVPSDERSEPIVYTIDNGIELDFIKDQEKKDLHTEMLVKLFASIKAEKPEERFANVLAKAMKESICRALDPEDDSGYNLPELTQEQLAEKKTPMKVLKEELAPFKKFVEERGEEIFLVGIEKMIGYLKISLIEKFDQHANELDIDPKIILALKERFTLLRNSL
jgi:hypothetical protein